MKTGNKKFITNTIENNHRNKNTKTENRDIIVIIGKVDVKRESEKKKKRRKK